MKDKLYALIRVLSSDGKIYFGDEHLKRLADDAFLFLQKIIIQTTDSYKLEYRREKNSAIDVYINDEFTHNVKNLDGTELENITDEDINIKLQFRDPNSDAEFVLGHKIKSDPGNPPTLFNASRATNFIFSVGDMTDEEMNDVNAIDTDKKIKDRLSRIKNLNFVSTANETFSDSLLFLCFGMEKILAEILKIYYVEGVAACAELATLLEERDPFKLNVTGIYRHKLKKFLCAVALGLNPSKQWSGIDEANGGYIIVTETGEVLAYHLYNRDNFETYLLNNTKLETGSTSRHEFASIYIGADGKKYINLNLQIRFK